MAVTAATFSNDISAPSTLAHATERDVGIDTIRGIAILMVIGIHSTPQPMNTSWQIFVDSALRACVPTFLFASGYLTALSGHVTLWKRFKTILVPYTIAFVAAYIYMAAHNPEMDHRPSTTIARYVLAYVFVYYYVFIYIGCTIGFWLAFRIVERVSTDTRQRLVVILFLSIPFGLIAGSYIDPLLARFSVPNSTIQEVRLRDVPFWFCFAALGGIIGASGTSNLLHSMRSMLACAAILTYAIYVSVRMFHIGDSAEYDSSAFFGYASFFCLFVFSTRPRFPILASIGTGSYFIYLWHIFVIMVLRDHVRLHDVSAVFEFAFTFLIGATISVTALYVVRKTFPSRLSRWLGA